MQPYYDYLISDTIYKGVECYVFMVIMKEDIKNENKVIIKNWFHFLIKIILLFCIDTTSLIIRI